MKLFDPFVVSSPPPLPRPPPEAYFWLLYRLLAFFVLSSGLNWKLEFWTSPRRTYLRQWTRRCPARMSALSQNLPQLFTGESRSLAVACIVMSAFVVYVSNATLPPPPSPQPKFTHSPHAQPSVPCKPFAASIDIDSTWQYILRLRDNWYTSRVRDNTPWGYVKIHLETWWQYNLRVRDNTLWEFVTVDLETTWQYILRLRDNTLWEFVTIHLEATWKYTLRLGDNITWEFVTIHLESSWQ